MGGGTGDFVAEEEGAGEVGDEVVPAVVAGVVVAFDVVTGAAGEVVGRKGEGVGMREGGFLVEELDDAGGGEGVVEGFGGFVAGGAEPAEADELEARVVGSGGILLALEGAFFTEVLVAALVFELAAAEVVVAVFVPLVPGERVFEGRARGGN